MALMETVVSLLCSRSSKFIEAVFMLLSTFFIAIHGHGRLMKPVGRASLWRDPEYSQFNPVPDYNDMECFCGGFKVQYEMNGGKCGVCGDPWQERQPRAHEDGGIYGAGIVTGNYTMGDTINVSVELTTSHLGYFEFRLCPRNNRTEVATQDCLNKYVLKLADGTGTRYPITSLRGGWYNYTLKLPQDVTCQSCLLQWHYRVGNSHGRCADGTYRRGCGNQEVFRGCADICIS